VVSSYYLYENSEMRVDQQFKVQVNSKARIRTIYFFPNRRIFTILVHEVFTSKNRLPKQKRYPTQTPFNSKITVRIDQHAMYYARIKWGFRGFKRKLEDDHIWRCSSPTAKTAPILRGFRDKEGPDEVESRAEGQKGFSKDCELCRRESRRYLDLRCWHTVWS
jgi:hypothetical protein